MNPSNDFICRSWLSSFLFAVYLFFASIPFWFLISVFLCISVAANRGLFFASRPPFDYPTHTRPSVFAFYPSLFNVHTSFLFFFHCAHLNCHTTQTAVYFLSIERSSFPHVQAPAVRHRTSANRLDAFTFAPKYGRLINKRSCTLVSFFSSFFFPSRVTSVSPPTLRIVGQTDTQFVIFPCTTHCLGMQGHLHALSCPT